MEALHRQSQENRQELQGAGSSDRALATAERRTSVVWELRSAMVADHARHPEDDALAMRGAMPLRRRRAGCRRRRWPGHG